LIKVFTGKSCFRGDALRHEKVSIILARITDSLVELKDACSREEFSRHAGFSQDGLDFYGG
jgi:hypothetical protein